ncbi:MAG: hypothetical protein JWP27_2916 [Flaviaesturariibacter sp.]|nr:hypothetical protein [Flaviaesturariibacter sp.]
MRSCLLLFFLSVSLSLCAQVLTGVVADSTSRKGLAFATVQLRDQRSGVITDINGQFSVRVSTGQPVTFSYIGHAPRTIEAGHLRNGDTVFLGPSAHELGEVIVRSDEKRIARIVNTAVRNKPLHNPEQYASYECLVYYKMSADLLGLVPESTDSAAARLHKAAVEADSALGEPDFFSPDRHLLVAETYSRRLYRKPQQLQEIILASRFSGLKKTYFHNTVTDVLPFHLYTDYINLGGIDYSNPIARGWQGRYRFHLVEELQVGTDTVFLLSFEPRAGAAFNGLEGQVYINSNGYAISHFLGATGDTTKDRQIHFEQVYAYRDGRWFPRELNYQLVMRRVMSKTASLDWHGHSVIDSVVFDRPASIPFDKAHPVRLHDSIDLHGPADWQRFRGDTIEARDQATYLFMDSFATKYKLERIITATSRLSMGRLPIGVIDLDVNRLIAQNDYEGTRLGAGFYTNDKLWKRVSAGGWAGFSFKDHQWKGGASITAYTGFGRESWVKVGVEDAYRNPGEVRLHEELTRQGLRNWLLGRPERVREVRLSANLRTGYWEWRPEVSQARIRPLVAAPFVTGGKEIPAFTATEAAIGFRYAYGERRVPVFEDYIPEETKYPIAYVRLARGTVHAAGYDNRYLRALAAVTYTFHGNRWGRDAYRLEVGWVKAGAGALPRSFLMAGNGVRLRSSHYYSAGGFVTMRPFDYYSDRYLSLLYRHDMDRFFWDTRLSKPFLGFVHNAVVGGLGASSIAANPGIRTYSGSYQESGLLVNQLLRYNLHVTDVYLNVGLFHQWEKGAAIRKNNFFVFSISTGF